MANCPSCRRPVAVARATCLYCGAPLPPGRGRSDGRGGRRAASPGPCPEAAGAPLVVLDLAGVNVGGARAGPRPDPSSRPGSSRGAAGSTSTASSSPRRRRRKRIGSRPVGARRPPAARGGGPRPPRARAGGRAGRRVARPAHRRGPRRRPPRRRAARRAGADRPGVPAGRRSGGAWTPRASTRATACTSTGGTSRGRSRSTRPPSSSALAVTGSARLEIDAWVEEVAGGAPCDDGFRRLPPALGPAEPEPKGALAAVSSLGLAARGQGSGRDEGPVVLDNVAQFRFYSGWRAAVERRRAARPSRVAPWRRRDLLLILLLAVAPLLAYAPAWSEGRLLAPGDGAALHLPLRAEVWRAWGRGEVPSWNGSFLLRDAAPRLVPAGGAPSPHRRSHAARALRGLPGARARVARRSPGPSSFSTPAASGPIPSGPSWPGSASPSAPTSSPTSATPRRWWPRPRCRSSSSPRRRTSPEPRAATAAFLALAVALLLLAGSPEAVGAGALLLVVRLLVAFRVPPAPGRRRRADDGSLLHGRLGPRPASCSRRRSSCPRSSRCARRGPEAPGRPARRRRPSPAWPGSWCATCRTPRPPSSPWPRCRSWRASPPSAPRRRWPARVLARLPRARGARGRRGAASRLRPRPRPPRRALALRPVARPAASRAGGGSAGSPSSPPSAPRRPCRSPPPSPARSPRISRRRSASSPSASSSTSPSPGAARRWSPTSSSCRWWRPS